jgi:hypothetical protein|tara:strand:- start:251 stop:631 length:381 start_codon:yes stop_codon:yes gene_type:complete
LKAFAKIKRGKIEFDDKAKFLNDVAEFHEGARIVIQINEAQDVRSNQQNRLWWAWMTILGNELGYTKNEMNDTLKYKFLLYDETIDGDTHQVLKSTSTLTKEEFKQLTNDVYFWANDTFNINLPNE